MAASAAGPRSWTCWPNPRLASSRNRAEKMFRVRADHSECDRQALGRLHSRVSANSWPKRMWAELQRPLAGAEPRTISAHRKSPPLVEHAAVSSPTLSGTTRMIKLHTYNSRYGSVPFRVNFPLTLNYLPNQSESGLLDQRIFVVGAKISADMGNDGVGHVQLIKRRAGFADPSEPDHIRCQ